MKNAVLILVFITNYCSQNNPDLKTKLSVDIWDYNYSMAYTILYHIDNDSLVVQNIGNLENENVKYLIKRKLTDQEKNEINTFLGSFPIDRLKTAYKNPLVEDGDRKKVVLKLNDKIKTIEIANSYQEDISNLIDFINHYLKSEYAIRYSKVH